MNLIKVEVGQYRAINKGPLKATFSVIIYEEQPKKILDCLYFISGDRRWINFPSKEIEKDGKKEYIPLISYPDKEYAKQLKETILQQLKIEEAKHASNVHQRQANPVQAQSSVSPQEPLPF